MNTKEKVLSTVPITRLIPKKLGMQIFLADLLAFIGAYGFLVCCLKQYWDMFHLNYEASFSGVFDYQFFLFVMLEIMALVSFAYHGDYTRRIPWWGQVRHIVKIVCICLIINGFAYFSLKVSLSALIVLTNWVLTGFFLVCTRYIAFSIISRSKDWSLPVAILGDKQMIIDTLFAFSSDGFTGYKPALVLLRDKEENTLDCTCLPPGFENIRIETVGNEHNAYIEKNKNYFYVIGMEGFREHNRDHLIDTLDVFGIEYAIIPPTRRLHTQSMRPHHFFGTDIILLHNHRKMNMPLSRFLKRLMDVLASGCVLPFLGLLTMFVFILKKLEGSKTPVFYGGKRPGLNGKMFHCWKFCTMKQNGDALLQAYLAENPSVKEEWDTFQKLKKDPRIDSKVSEFLRKTSLDEVPQLWNVFVGDMSLVGPRPILEDQKEDYGKTIKLYNSVRPGLTGLWQVSGRNNVSFEQRVLWDDWYIRNWSLWHDIVILFKTVGVLFTGKGAY